MPKESKPNKTYTVIRDTREQQGWRFPAERDCLGTVVETLRTGDYTLKGYESILCVERKQDTGEIATNLTQGRFERELERMDAYALPFLVCEFSMKEIISFPFASGVPREKWRSLRVTPQFILKRLNEIQIKHKVKILLWGDNAQECMSSLFRRVVENVSPVETDN